MVMSTKKIVRGIDESLNKAVSEINASTPKPDMKDDGAELKAAVAPKNDLSFAEAFKANRMAGNKTFTWKGKSYNTKMAGEGASRSEATRRPATETPKPAAKSGVKPETEKFVNNLRSAMYLNGKNVAFISDKVKPSKRSDYTPVWSLKSKSDAKPAASTAKAEPKRDNTAAGRRERMGKFLSSLNPYNQADAKGKSSRPLLLTGEAARKANKGTIGGYAKGGKIDGCAVRGKTRAMRKK